MSAIYKCAKVVSYEEAEKVFKATKPVRQRKATSYVKWADNNRPLHRGANRSAYFNYRLVRQERNGVVFFDVMNGSCIAARFHKPTRNALGQEERVCFYNWSYRADHTAFVWQVLEREWATKRDVVGTLTTTGHRVMTPIGGATSKHATIDPVDNAPFTLRLFFVDDKLDTARSHHVPCYTRVSTSQDRAERAEVVKRVETLVDLAVMRLPTMEAEANIGYRFGRPFASTPGAHKWTECRGLADPSVVFEDAMTESAMDAFFKLAQSVYDMLASKRAYKDSAWNMTKDATKLTKPITEADFRAAMIRFVLKMSGASQNSGKKYLPMWPSPDEMPKKVCVD